MPPTPLGTVDAPLEEIEPDPVELERKRDPDKQAGLARDLAANGQLQECLASEKTDGKYRLYVGHGRYLAALAAKLKTLRLLLYPLLPPNPVRLMRLRENIHRKDYETYELYERLTAVLADTPGMTQKQLAEALSYSPSLICQYLALNKCVPEVHAAVKAGKLWVSDLPKIAAVSSERQGSVLNMRLQQGAPLTARKPRAESVRLDRLKLTVSGVALTLAGEGLGLSEVAEALSAAEREVNKAIRAGSDIRALNALHSARAKAK